MCCSGNKPFRSSLVTLLADLVPLDQWVADRAVWTGQVLGYKNLYLGGILTCPSL
jgi:hypothetical protein